MTIQQAFELALQHHRAGRLAEAEALYRQILAVEPRHADALHLLGVIAHQAGRNEVAVELIHQAIALTPGVPGFHSNLGEACRAAGQLDQAIAAYRQAIALQPDFPAALSNLGNVLTDKGQVDAAIAAFRQAIALQPDFPEAHNNLGNVLKDRGQVDEAIASYRQAIALEPNFPEALSNLGSALKDKDQANEAIASYRQAIALRPNYPEALNNLGIVLRDKGQFDEAIASYRQAIALKPSYADAHNNLGNVLKDKGQVDEAIAAYRQAIALKPSYPEALSNLGNVLKDQGQVDEAIAAYRQAIALKPSYPEVHNNLGNVLKDKGQVDAAIASYRQAIALKPNYPEAFSNLGNALKDKGQADEAIAAYRQAIALKPNYAEAHNNLGNVLKGKGQVDEAIASYRQAIALKPNLPEAISNLGSTLKDQGQFDEAIAACRQAIALKPHFPEAHNNLGNIFKDQGQVEEAIAAYRQAITLEPGFTEAHSNLVYTLHFHPGFDSRAIAGEHRCWRQQHAEPLRQFIQPHPNDRTPERRLRIGYVSPDFRDHVVGYNLLPLLAGHDHDQFEIFCYAQVARPDALTDRFRASAQHWRGTIGLSHEQLAAQVREDQIDILVDLALHMAYNRLPVFARKPAPVQVTFAGYPGSTGLDTIDYRLSDPYLDPSGINESLYSEQTVRLPHSFWCYDPLDAGDLPVNTLPTEVNGFITFGCLNNFCKINDAVLRLWAKVLRAVPSSRLLLLAPEGHHRQHALDVLGQEGIASERLAFVSGQPRRKYLELYHRIDLGLDTLPYNGHTTSLDSFWMGVPVVTLVGQTIVGRAGLSQLMNLKLPELITQTPEQFVQVATGLASDLPRLAALRSTLRQHMTTSPLMDAPRFARDIETAYRQMWRQWCTEQNL